MGAQEQWGEKNHVCKCFQSTINSFLLVCGTYKQSSPCAAIGDPFLGSECCLGKGVWWEGGQQAANPRVRSCVVVRNGEGKSAKVFQPLGQGGFDVFLVPW